MSVSGAWSVVFVVPADRHRACPCGCESLEASQQALFVASYGELSLSLQVFSTTARTLSISTV
jgi:hypothetical protein